MNTVVSTNGEIENSGAPRLGFFRRYGLTSGVGLSVIAVVLLFIISFILAPSSVSLAAILTMAPFAAILGIASLGQQLVIQQRGLDLSVAGAISLVSVIATINLSVDPSVFDVISRLVLAVIVAVAAGLFNGFLVVKLHIPPLVTTIGVNAILMGFVIWLSGGTPGNAPDMLDEFAIGRTLSVPNTVWVALVVVAIVALILGRTIVGRRFVLSGTNAFSARAAGIRIQRYEIGAYAMAGLCYAIAGILLAGLLNVPSLNVGDSYLLATVAAVVIGGNSLAGGKASAIATVIGALFMVQLSQMLIAAGLDRSVQYLLQGAIVIAGASVHILLPQWLRR